MRKLLSAASPKKDATLKFDYPIMAVDKARPNKRKEKHISSSSSQTKKKQKKGGGTHDGKKKAVVAEDSGSNSAKRRQLKKERQSHRRHADVVAEAKLIWNKLRLKEGSSSSDEKKSLMDTLMTLIRGKIYDIALQHDASRVVQAAIQFGSKDQRKEILDELLDTTADDSANHTLPELSKVQYAHFVTLKLIKYCSRDDDSVKLIVKVRIDQIKFVSSCALRANSRMRLCVLFSIPLSLSF